MVTKLKNSRLRKFIKVVIFLMIISSLALAAVQLQLGLRKEINQECLFEPDYHRSRTFYTVIDEALGQVTMIAFNRVEPKDVPYYYYLSTSSMEYTNIGATSREFYEQYDRAFFYMEQGVWKNGPNSYSKTDNFYHGLFYYNTAYVAFPDDYIDIEQSKWDQNRALLMPGVITFVLNSIIGLLLTIFSCIIIAREPQDDRLHLKNLDKVYTELLLLAFGVGGWLYFTGMPDILRDNISIGIKMDMFGLDFIKMFTTENNTMAIFIAVVTALASSALLIILHSIIRKLKAKRFHKDSILYRGLKKLSKVTIEMFRYLCYGDLFHNASFAINLGYRQMIFLTGTTVLTSLVTLLIVEEQAWFLIPLAVELLIIIWYTKGSKRIYDNIDKEIRDRTEEQMKSERMKVELITNVSHDLKTPITSIISFIDLLSKENSLSDSARDYVGILQEKSERLKNIVTDLFDLAKSTSGDMTLNLETIDLGKLICQTLADMEDRITDSELTFKTKFSDQPIHIRADGNKLYRVFQNVIDNALKYAMHGTRVYVELSLVDGKAIATVKNIAGYDMNFTSQEILQRFTRGDQARTSEGSGLGLSIAASYTKLCGGDFQVELEGDMFKVFLSFAQVSDPISVQAAETEQILML